MKESWAETRDALKILARVTGDDTQLRVREVIEEETVNAHVVLWCEACQKETLDKERIESLADGPEERFRYCSECNDQKKDYQPLALVHEPYQS